ncbi:MAG: iron ABC transporter permease [Candidatus Saccharibacteria bacterium]|nr:iron ABC transporter permease [Candidatus Saccharibacteria bacterium]
MKVLRLQQRYLPFDRPVRVSVLLIALLVAGMLLSLCRGSVHLTLDEVWQALWHQGSVQHQTIVWELRLPRILAAVLVGAALGMSGGLLQGMLRNSLADPFILGISAGAGLVAILCITLAILPLYLPLGAWLGAMLTAALVYTLSYRSGNISVERLILAGIAISSLFGSIQTLLLLWSDESRLQSALNWLVGSLNGRGWSVVQVAAPYVLLGILAGCALARPLNLLGLGDEVATSLGVSLLRTRLLIGLVASLLAGCAVSIAGLVGFIGLIVPHGVRLLVGNDYRWLLPLSAIGGATVLLLADLLARLGAIEFPVGAVTSLMGSPVFIWLLYQRQSANDRR